MKMLRKAAFVTGVSGFAGAHPAAKPTEEENVEVVGLQHKPQKRSYFNSLGIIVLNEMENQKEK